VKLLRGGSHRSLRPGAKEASVWGKKEEGQLPADFAPRGGAGSRFWISGRGPGKRTEYEGKKESKKGYRHL